jgi:hypothetical protein
MPRILSLFVFGAAAKLGAVLRDALPAIAEPIPPSATGKRPQRGQPWTMTYFKRD